MPPRELSGKDPAYEFISSLGQGGFGSVAKVRRISDNMIMACKAIDCSSHPQLVNFASREIETWAAFATSEKYIANFGHDVAWSHRTQTMRLYMKFYEGGDMQRVIETCRHEELPVHPFMATYWAMEVARGVKACHDYGIIHRDLKPANVLLAMPYKYNEMLWAVSEGETLTDSQKTLASEFLTWMEERPAWCHITDFGLGKFSPAAVNPGHHTVASIGSLGTPGFMAPETMGESPVFSVKSDIYSLGCLLYSLCSGRPPPSRLPGVVVPSIPSEFPKRMRDIVAQCMLQDPAQRPNSREASNEISEAYLDLLEDDKFGRMKPLLKRILNTAVATRPNNTAPLADTISPAQVMPFLGFKQGGDAKSHQTPESYPPPAYGVSGGTEDFTLTQLRSAIEKDNVEIVKVMLASEKFSLKDDAFGLSPAKNDWILSHDFAYQRLIRSLHHLGEDNDNSGQVKIDLLHFAAFSKSWSVMFFLLRQGATCRKEPYMGSPLISAIASNELGVIRTLVLDWHFKVADDAVEISILGEAMSCGCVEAPTVELLMTLGANPREVNPYGETAFHRLGGKYMAVNLTDKSTAIAKVILGAAPNLLNSRDRWGSTPLLSAVRSSLRHGRQEDGARVITFLISLGANPFEKGPKGEDAFYTRLERNEKIFSNDRVMVPARDYPVLNNALLSKRSR
ncbi:hypothetical protein H072_6638 [Dactylellina haptotyla CBS 200.50]|uniref:non-specific serine/threonine protein kinase n=1 Tax=Dactylellina haptotyla (strain CBS 200.50) TaxID=1284197 RepID=S8AEG0_DACHA|nr:hypothetical protein H072_6638 [Dactylellina haptotyla CBS 200.50]